MSQTIRKTRKRHLLPVLILKSQKMGQLPSSDSLPQDPPLALTVSPRVNRKRQAKEGSKIQQIRPSVFPPRTPSIILLKRHCLLNSNNFKGNSRLLKMQTPLAKMMIVIVIFFKTNKDSKKMVIQYHILKCQANNSNLLKTRWKKHKVCVLRSRLSKK